MDKIKEIKEKWKKEGIENEKLSKEDTCKVNRWLDEGISVIRREYQRRKAGLIEPYRTIYFNF